MVSSKQGIDVVVIVFIVARRFFFNEFLNLSGCLIRCVLGRWGLFGLIRHRLAIVCEEVILAVVSKQVVPVVVEPPDDTLADPLVALREPLYLIRVVRAACVLGLCWGCL